MFRSSFSNRAVVALLLMGLPCLSGCQSGDGTASSASGVSAKGTHVVTRSKDSTETAWQRKTVTLRIEQGCVLASGQMAVLPYGSYIDEAWVLHLPGSEPVALDDPKQVSLMGSTIQFKDQDLPAQLSNTNRENWNYCRDELKPSEYSDWWQVSTIDPA